jgi:hypothetical protein
MPGLVVFPSVAAALKRGLPDLRPDVLWLPSPDENGSGLGVGVGQMCVTQRNVSITGHTYERMRSLGISYTGCRDS